MTEEKELQKANKSIEEVKEEVKEEITEKKEVQKGYYLAEVTTQTGIVLVKDKKQISEQELLVKVANAIEEAGLFK